MRDLREFTDFLSILEVLFSRHCRSMCMLTTCVTIPPNGAFCTYLNKYSLGVPRLIRSYRTENSGISQYPWKDANFSFVQVMPYFCFMGAWYPNFETLRITNFFVEEKSVSIFTISSYDAPFWKQWVRRIKKLMVWYCVCVCVYTCFSLLYAYRT